MFDFSVFPMAFSIGSQNCTVKYQNMCNWIPILTRDTSMNSWWNYLIICIKVLLLKEGHNFNPFSCSIFRNLQWLSVLEPKIALLSFITWVIGSRFRRGIPLWICGGILFTRWSHFVTNFHVWFFSIPNGFQFP